MIVNTQNQPTKSFNNTGVPDNLDIELATSLDTVKNYTNFLETFGSYVTELSAAINYRASLQAPDNVSAMGDFYSALDNNYFDNFNLEFIHFWTKKYKNTTNQEIQERTKSKLESENNLQSYYDEVSDSIGLLVNSKVKLDDSVIPYFDTHLYQYSQPVTWPVSINNKLSDNAKEISESLSRKTSTLLRTNLVNIQFSSRGTMINKLDPTLAHGNNLVTDLKYFVDHKKNMFPYVKLIQQLYYRTHTYISYFSNINDGVAYNPRNFSADETYSNLQIMYRYLFDVKVEGLTQKLDILKKKAIPVTSTATIQRSLASLQSTKTQPSSAVSTNTSTVDTQYFNTVEDKTAATFFNQTTNINSFFDYTPKVNGFISEINKQITNPIAKLDEQISTIFSSSPAFKYVSEIADLGVPLGLPSLNLNEFLPGNFIPNLDNTGITGSITEISRTLGNFGLPNIIPGISFGSLETLANLGPNIVMNPAMLANPTTALAYAQQIKDVACNFIPPTVDTDNLFDFTTGIETMFKDIESKIAALVNNIESFFDYDKLAAKIKFNFKSLFKDFFKKYFTCNK
jgi:hypothetical protein